MKLESKMTENISF